MDLLDRLTSDPLPFAKLLGIELVGVEPERVVARMTVREDLCTKPATLHGGAMMAFADTLGAIGTIANLEEGATTVTVESKTNFLRPAPLGARLLGESTPVHRGKRMMVWQTKMTTEDGRLVALTTQTQLVMRN
jgi:uncharacterized protein (TIGR00369 family)